MITIVLWPFAYKYSELLYNHLHVGEEDDISSALSFSGAQIIIGIGDFQTWGCPCYVLVSRAQNNNMVPKWDPRSRLGIYVGHSPCRAGSVALFLNPKTMNVSPQHHLVFDDKFTIVPFLASEEIPSNWAELVAKSESTTTTDYDLAQIWIQANLNTDVSSNDTLTLTEMLKEEDIDEFVRAMVKEVADHEDREH